MAHQNRYNLKSEFSQKELSMIDEHKESINNSYPGDEQIRVYRDTMVISFYSFMGRIAVIKLTSNELSIFNPQNSEHAIN